MTKIKEWDRFLCDGLYQFVAETQDGELIGCEYDISDGYKCRETWELIKFVHPVVDNYPDFCRAYREAAEEYAAYCQRDERRYKKYWGKRA